MPGIGMANINVEEHF